MLLENPYRHKGDLVWVSVEENQICCVSCLVKEALILSCICVLIALAESNTLNRTWSADNAHIAIFIHPFFQLFW